MYLWMWVAVIVITVIFELATLCQLVSIWFSFGGLLALIAYFLGASFTIQVVIFFISSVLFLLLLKPVVNKHVNLNRKATNYDRYIGRQYTLIKDIGYEPGKIKINDLDWTVVSEDGEAVDKDSMVEIIAFEGSKAIVRKVD